MTPGTHITPEAAVGLVREDIMSALTRFQSQGEVKPAFRQAAALAREVAIPILTRLAPGHPGIALTAGLLQAWEMAAGQAPLQQIQNPTPPPAVAGG